MSKHLPSKLAKLFHFAQVFAYLLLIEEEGELTRSGGGVYFGGYMILSSGRDSLIDPSL